MTKLPRYWLIRCWLLLAFLGLAACAHRDPLPPPPAPAVEVKVPVPVACKVEEVPQPEYPQIDPNMNIHELAIVLLAERQVRLAEIERLRGALSDPCPEPKDNSQ